MLLLSAGTVVVSVLHDLLQCCIITDTQQLLQAWQSSCTALGRLSCASSMTNMTNLIDVELGSEHEFVR